MSHDSQPLPKTLQPPHRLWVFGQSYDFHVVTLDGLPLDRRDYVNTSQQKTQIVLHNTGGNSSAEATIRFWNTPTQTSANFVVERKLTAQAARPATTADQTDSGLVDAVRVIAEDLYAYHAGNFPFTPNYGLSATSLGIEISCLGEALFEKDDHGNLIPAINATTEEDGTYRITTAAVGQIVGEHRASDLNRWIRMTRMAGGRPKLAKYEGRTDIQALDDEQYMTLTLLLRHLCINHRIPRQFFGTSYEEIFQHWFYPDPIIEEWRMRATVASPAFATFPPAKQASLQQELAGLQRRLPAAHQQQRIKMAVVQNFRGILVHRNVNTEKICPGVVDRNRLFRGISDEWWLPVQPDGVPRPYYSGPFKKPDFVKDAAKETTKNSYFRYLPGSPAAKIQGAVFRDADMDALLDTFSYYKISDVDSYYGMVETQLGGLFPMGTNKVWHGGVHFGVKDSNPCVFSAAGGTIVAARMSSNKDTDAFPGFGSQRFVLLKHAIHRETLADSSGTGRHIDYTQAPNRVFSLYMHLEAVKDISKEDDENPPWFNLWRRANPAVDIGMNGDKGKVFAPNIQVLLGDILGTAGFFRGRRMIHFEIVSHANTELMNAPWDDVKQRADDPDQDLICNAANLEDFLTPHFHLPPEQINPADVAQLLRKCKARHKSEWSLTSDAQIETLVSLPARRAVLWPHIQRFSWVTEAIAAYPRLKDELGDEKGMFWHYHPITFMQHMNQLVLAENRTSEDSPTATFQHNVELGDDYYLTRFVEFRGGSYVPVNVDNRNRIKVTEISQSGWEYHFTRADIACMQTGTHFPESTPPQTTRFSLALLGIMEQIYQYLDQAFKVALSHICNSHLQAGLCVMNDINAAANHLAGNAVDIRPANATASESMKLWNAVAAIVDPFNSRHVKNCGMASQADLPLGCSEIRYTTTQAAHDALTSKPQNIPGAEVAGFRIHLEMVYQTNAAAVPGKANLRVSFLFCQIINADRFAGQATITGKVNGGAVNSASAGGSSPGQLISLDWTSTVSQDPTLPLVISLELAAATAANNDHATASLTAKDNPAWGAGTTSVASGASSFVLRYKVEWDQGDL